MNFFSDKVFEDAYCYCFCRGFICQIHRNDHNNFAITDNNAPGQTGASPQPIGTFFVKCPLVVALDDCNDLLVSSASEFWVTSVLVE